jgi:GR25 family glycosyltransferase involved in LPS biosynthesis
MINKAKLNIRNFGAKKIFVISDKDNIQRRKDFEDAWSGFKNFNYEFVDAIMGKDLDVTQLIKDKKILGKFYGHIPSLSKNLLGSILSHEKVWNLILNEDKNQTDVESQNKDWYLILEDDARPTNEFYESIYQGEYKEILNQINKYEMYLFFWGRTKSFINGNIHNDYLLRPVVDNDHGAHAYMIKPYIAQLFLNKSHALSAADIFMDYRFKSYSFSPYKTFINQQGHLLGKFFMDPKDENYLYSSGTQYRNEKDDTIFRTIHPDIRDNVKKIEYGVDKDLKSNPFGKHQKMYIIYLK